MPWINTDSYLLVKTAIAKDFALKNNLRMSGDLNGANFFNEHVLIKIYEETSYLHADYYDLINWRWGRELHNFATEAAIPSLPERKKLIETFEAEDDVLSAASMKKFKFFLYTIDMFMQDFLAGKFSRFADVLQPLDAVHRTEIKRIVTGNEG